MQSIKASSNKDPDFVVDLEREGLRKLLALHKTGFLSAEKINQISQQKLFNCDVSPPFIRLSNLSLVLKYSVFAGVDVKPDDSTEERLIKYCDKIRHLSQVQIDILNNMIHAYATKPVESFAPETLKYSYPEISRKLYGWK